MLEETRTEPRYLLHDIEQFLEASAYKEDAVKSCHKPD